MHFSAQAGKIKKIHPWKISYALILKILYIFSQLLLYFRKRNPPQKNSYIVSKESFSYTLGNGSPPKIFMFRKRYFLIFHEKELSELEKKKPTLKKCLRFREIELSSSKLKKILIFQE